MIQGLFIILGIFSAGMGLKGFLLSSRFIDGGVTGISMLLSDITGSQLSLWIVIVNIPFIILGYFQIGKMFAVKSVLSIVGLSLCLYWVPFPDVTPDKLLTALFGGIFIGAGIALTIRGGAVLDGTDIAALLISKNSHILKVGDVILIGNIFIFMMAAFFLGIESALYSILTYFSASKTVDFILHGVEEYTALTIVSSHNTEIKNKIVTQLKRGVTVFNGLGGQASVDGGAMSQEILLCVVTRLEIGMIKQVIKDIDPNAFIITNALSEVDGGLLKRSSLY